MNWRTLASLLCFACLVGCGGAEKDADTPTQQLVAAMHAQSVATVRGEVTTEAPAASAGRYVPPLYVGPSELFEWAEWMYPELFPPAAQIDWVVYQGRLYELRIYSNGNVLGVPGSSGIVYGVGPFTQGQIRSFGSLDAWSPRIQEDACLFRSYDCQKPSWRSEPVGVHTVQGQAAQFSAEVFSTLPLSLQWEESTDGGRRFTPVAGATAATLTLPPVSLQDNGRVYRLRAANRDGQLTSRSVVLTVRPPNGTNFFPLTEGALWLYQRTAYGPPDMRRVAGPGSLPDGPAGVLVESVYGSDGSVGRELYVASTDGVRVYTPVGGDETLRAFDGMQVMRHPVVPGESVEQRYEQVDSGVDIDHDGRAEPARVATTMTVVGFEPLATPAAQFHQTLHIRHVIQWTLLPTQGGDPLEIRSIVDLWYADGVGEVKSMFSTTVLGFTETDTLLLESYRVGDHRSDIEPPGLVSLEPQSPQHSRVSIVRASFNDRLDPASVNADSLMVFDAQGRRIAGRVSTTDRSLVFTPDVLIPAGEYSAQVAAGLRDRTGNGLPVAQRWTFKVDITRPRVASVLPADGARDVNPGASVVVRFSESVLPASVTTRNITLHAYEGMGEAVLASLSVQGDTVTLTPKLPLLSGMGYGVRVRGVADLSGQPLEVEASSLFRTADWRFAAPLALPGAMAKATQFAVGDVNADGRADVLGWTFATAVTDPGPYIQHGLPGGGLGPPVKLIWQEGSTCEAGRPMLGDLDGDGRLDMVVDGRGCGLRVWMQAADGTWRAGQRVDPPRSLSRLLDLDDQRQRALVTVFEGRLQIWRRSTSGLLEISQIVDTGLRDIVDVLAGDVNGDGRADLVIQLGLQSPGEIAVLPRLAGGDFAPATVLRLDQGALKARSIALGDLNGDGRTDVVAALGDGPSVFMIAILHQTSTGSLAAPVHLLSHGWPQSMVVADVNRDGRIDLLVSHAGSGAAGLYVQGPDGRLMPQERAEVAVEHEASEQMAVADVDGDGLPDVLLGGSVLRQRVGGAEAAVAATARSGGMGPRVALRATGLRRR